MFGASGFVFNIANGNWVMTHTSAIMTVGTGDLRVTTAGTNTASVVTVGGTQTLTAKTLTTPTMTGPIVTTSAMGLQVGQIAFPATQNPSADANTLDDYEEGSFTPGVSFGGGATGVTYATQVGTYVKIGQFVYCQGLVTLTNNGSNTGQARLTGFPFTAAATAVGLVYFPSYSSLTTVTTVPFGYVESSTTTALISVAGAGASSGLTDANIGNAASLFFVACYRAAA